MQGFLQYYYLFFGLQVRVIKTMGLLFLGFAVTMLWTVGGLFMFLMSATDLRTYAGYLKKKRAYFGEMETEIRKSKNYDDFFDNFY